MLREHHSPLTADRARYLALAHSTAARLLELHIEKLRKRSQSLRKLQWSEDKRLRDWGYAEDERVNARAMRCAFVKGANLASARLWHREAAFVEKWGFSTGSNLAQPTMASLQRDFVERWQ